MTMLHRPTPTLPSWLGVTGAFAIGAAVVWLANWALEHLKHGPGPLSDDIVLSRVRSRIGQLVSRPEAVDVSVENGVVRLSGQVPPEERDALLTQLLYMPGVVRLRNALALR
jgi:hypothetical protein